MSKSQSKVVLSTIENFQDVTNKQRPANGTLALIRNDETYQIHWAPLDGTSTQSITAVFDYLKVPDNDNWSGGECFNVDCPKISSLLFDEKPYQISVGRLDKKTVRTFVVDDAELISVTIFIEQLLINGIAVPSMIQRYSLDFYQSGHRNTYPFTPAHIQLKAMVFSSLEELWNNVFTFFEKLMIHLDASSTLPQDPSFPINTAARALHERVVEKIDKYVKSIPQYEAINSETFSLAFDENGKIKDAATFKLRLFHAVKEKELLPKLIPYAVGLYPYESSKAERDEIDDRLKTDFLRLEEEYNLLMQIQIDNNDKIMSAYRTIDHDVTRTDRGISAFKSQENPGLQMLTKLLKIYVLYNPPISYLQGMNDLFVPFITTFIPKWTDDGMPLDQDGNALDHIKLMPMIFWCFDSMLRNTRQIELLESVTEHCSQMAEEIQSLLTRISPLSAIWMRRNNLHALLWCYSDFVLMFKRSFENIWSTWMQFNASPCPQKFLIYFITAMLVCAFDQFATLPDVSITAMMDAFPRILSTLEAEYLGKVALWIAEQYSSVEPECNDEKESPYSFEFFDAHWKNC